MMKNLLEQDFISHYGLGINVTANVVATSVVEFDLNDDSQLVYQPGQGIAKYKNTTKKTVNVINYETYFKSLPSPFQQNKENCDLIVFTSDNTCFLLNELTDTAPDYTLPFTNTHGRNIGKEQKARSQLRQTIEILINVSAISQYINSYTVKRCCFFNKQSYIPQSINALQAFNRLNSQMPCGFNLSDQHIDALGFDFWVYSGNQVCSI
jgi:hypothetical protein